MKIGDGQCDMDFNGGQYFTKECGYDGGDCYKPVPGYPECQTAYPERVGDGRCHLHLAVPECGHDGGDCVIQFGESNGEHFSRISPLSQSIEVERSEASATLSNLVSLFIMLSTFVVQEFYQYG